MGAIAVYGSLNADLVIRMGRFPGPGETVRAESFEEFSGGKGANQAAAAGRLGGRVSMFGALGADGFAENLKRSLAESGVSTGDLLVVDDTPTGLAHIWVDGGGENAIAVLPGANDRVDAQYNDAILPKIGDASYLLLQLEVPLETMADLLRKLPKHSPRVILDPAPARSLETLPTDRIWVLTPNEHELKALTELPTNTDEEIRIACERLRSDTRVGAVICKAGSRGAFLYDGSRFAHFPGFSVTSIDSTAAGDAFNGALATALTEGRSLDDAIRFANAAGALTVTRPGAQQSLPRRGDLDRFVQANTEGGNA